MKNKLVVIVLMLFVTSSLKAQYTIEGVWKTIDDHSKKVRSLVQIYKGENGHYSGKVIKIFNVASNDPSLFCFECDEEDDRYNKPILEMEIIRNLKANKTVTAADGGTILDPDNGTDYRCKIEVINNGKRLKVRGYIGISLFGRTQIWIREK